MTKSVYAFQTFKHIETIIKTKMKDSIDFNVISSYKNEK